MIRAAWSDERVNSVIFESEEGLYVDVGAHEILRTSVPNVPSQRCSRLHLPPQLTLIHEENGTVAGRLLLCREYGRTNLGPVRAGRVAGTDLGPEHVQPQADFGGGETMEGTRQLSTRGREDQRAAACVNGPVESVPRRAKMRPLPCNGGQRSRLCSCADSERDQDEIDLAVGCHIGKQLSGASSLLRITACLYSPNVGGGRTTRVETRSRERQRRRQISRTRAGAGQRTKKKRRQRRQRTFTSTTTKSARP